ncbi:angiogenic factor with G patch and FHA domains 1 isoform X2 [Plutella xylostella]|uniref:angiogenic factor with G patch and FHA domains 1 isoform X2 n=1 Tax=Plutella xylostella TaxID=51655 RepID=UPI002032AE97|nr:angiogenic factor with G patch and FHA domains 1 isoform X2 [Plutella xylostella]
MDSTRKVKTKQVFLKNLKKSLKYRPKIYRLILNLRRKIREKNKLLKQKSTSVQHKDVSCQTDERNNSDDKEKKNKSQTNVVEEVPAAWNTDEHSGGAEKSIAEQVKEAAQSAMAQSGMVYVESAGMYYDYKTGYYYNSELGLYYHSDTGCYYYYSDEKQEFVFHSYPDTSMLAANEALKKHEQKKAKKHKQVGNTGDNIDCLVKSLSLVSLRNQTAIDSVAKHHPPCMRVIVRETKLPKLKVGSLFLITKDGGTVGREGEKHAILLNEHNVSRNHLQISYDSRRRGYVATDLGSKNGTTLNGTRMSASQPMEVPHGSTIQLGVTKLLCHIHPGNDTCGHCEPGLIMEAQEKEKKIAYTRTCSVQKQHALELARLKNKYVPEPLAIEDGSYKDRAKERREAVGSSHHSEKTQQSDLDTSIAPDNKGFKLLQKMGWSKGEGLGKDSQGAVEPVPLVSNESKVGLGAAGSAAPVQIGSVGSVPLKMNRRSKPLRPPARLFRDPLEDDDE